MGVLGRRGAQHNQARRLVAQIPIDAVEAGLKVVGMQARHQAIGRIQDLNFDGVGGSVEDEAQGGVGAFEEPEGGARRQEARGSGGVLRRRLGGQKGNSSQRDEGVPHLALQCMRFEGRRANA